MSVVMGWSLPSKIRESRRRTHQLELRSDQIVRDVNRASAVATYSATRLERAATSLMERHNQGMLDAAAELRRK